MTATSTSCSARERELRPGHLDQGGVLGVAHQQAGHPGRVLVDGAVHGHADAAVPRTAEVLDRRLAGAFDPERRGHPPACVGTKRIESPARYGTCGGVWTSKSTDGVRPTIRQPPGDAAL